MPPSPDPAVPPGRTSSGAPGGTVLVADDHAASRRLAQATLEDEGYRVVLAEHGRDAVAAFERERPDCVVLDVRMPELDGFGACACIRALPSGADVPVLFLTALRDVDAFDRAQRAGGDDYLTKPIRPAELVARVESALKIRRMGAALSEHFELLRHQRDDLMRLQLQKERLMSFVVHDLKNPVFAVDLNVHLILRNETLSADVRDCAEQIQNAAKHLNVLILNLLDVSKADAGKLVAKRTALDLGVLFREVRGELEAAASNRRTRIELALGAEVLRADGDLVRRVLCNLVENAIRYSPVGSVVTLGSRREADAVELRVGDNGAGVPPSLREKIFDPFTQLEGNPGGAATRGRGLGLAFCRQALEAHGGSIRVEDGCPGAVFCLRFPDVPA